MRDATVQEKVMFKCGFCGKLYDKPGYCQHGKVKVSLKKEVVVTGLRTDSLVGSNKSTKSYQE
jgi:hypothetical protein